MSIQEILESAGLPAQRGVYTGRDKPDAYYTFLRLLGTPAVNADDEEKERREMYRVNSRSVFISLCADVHFVCHHRVYFFGLLKPQHDIQPHFIAGARHADGCGGHSAVFQYDC